jgi:hypothetical protein
MKLYKGFTKDLKCLDFQYEIGKEYHEETADLCRAGFHACENPLDTFRYYAPGSSRYCEVELDEVSDQRDSDTKRAAKKIKIGAEIGLKGVIDAGVKFIFEKCEDATEERASGERGNAAASGWSGNAAASGWREDVLYLPANTEVRKQAENNVLRLHLANKEGRVEKSGIGLLLPSMEAMGKLSNQR